tara:strand:+ start:246 stop:497 length:252 start_codon:yes stop_codon:yes gene_type:complete
MIFLINIAFEILAILIIIRVFLSWFPYNQYHPLIQILLKITDPILTPIRSLIHPVGGIDLSPIIVVFLIKLIQNFIISFLISL